MQFCISKIVLLACYCAGQSAVTPQESLQASIYSRQSMISKTPAPRPSSVCVTTSTNMTGLRHVSQHIRCISRTDSAKKERKAGHCQNEFLSLASSAFIRKYLATERDGATLTHRQIHRLRRVSNLHCWVEGYHGRVQNQQSTITTRIVTLRSRL